ncbi:hypothetical protein AV530_018376 [Patagioenas fasciata monilis]|uniref:Uncharacterized protein n=1 Tax=Patagioenas fasciata monilis TaxID=372326 RepID=A0A1V4JT31_PATFA|nr:hypothetical protein AV530_018376 [Patagioenas fasciata monilis]
MKLLLPRHEKQAEILLNTRTDPCHGAPTIPAASSSRAPLGAYEASATSCSHSAHRWLTRAITQASHIYMF